MEARQTQLEDNWHYAELLKEKDAMVLQMRESLEQAVRDAESKGVELKNVHGCIDQMRDKHERDVQGHLKYSTANSNSLKRLHDRQTETELTLDEMAVLMAPYVDALRSRAGAASASSSKSQDKVVTVLDRTKLSVQKLCHKLEELTRVQRLYNELSAQSHYVLTHLGAADNGADLRAAFQDYVVRNDEHMMSVQERLTETEEQQYEEQERADRAEEQVQRLIEEQDNKDRQTDIDLVQKANAIQQLKNNTRELNNQLRSRQDLISALQDDLAKLQIQLSKKEDKKSTRRPTSPHFRDFSAGEDNVVQTPDVAASARTGGSNSITPHRSSQQQQQQLSKPTPSYAPHKRKGELMSGVGKHSRSLGRENSSVSFPPISSRGRPDVRPQQHQASIPTRAGQRRDVGLSVGLSGGSLLNVSGLQSTSPTTKVPPLSTLKKHL